MDKRFDSMDRRFEATDKRFEALDRRFDSPRQAMFIFCGAVIAAVASLIAMRL